MTRDSRSAFRNSRATIETGNGFKKSPTHTNLHRNYELTGNQNDFSQRISNLGLNSYMGSEIMSNRAGNRPRNSYIYDDR